MQCRLFQAHLEINVSANSNEINWTNKFHVSYSEAKFVVVQLTEHVHVCIAGSIGCWECKNGIGLKMQYKEGAIRYGYTLGANNVTYCIEGKQTSYVKIKKWSTAVFRIDRIGKDNYV